LLTLSGQDETLLQNLARDFGRSDWVVVFASDVAQAKGSLISTAAESKRLRLFRQSWQCDEQQLG
jgi:hypothetical protein